MSQQLQKLTTSVVMGKSFHLFQLLLIECQKRKRQLITFQVGQLSQLSLSSAMTELVRVEALQKLVGSDMIIFHYYLKLNWEQVNKQHAFCLYNTCCCMKIQKRAFCACVSAHGCKTSLMFQCLSSLLPLFPNGPIIQRLLE